MMRPLRCIFALLLTAPILAAEEIEISVGDSIFAVITHKAGFASGMAHNHLVTAAGFQAKLSFDESAPLDTRFELQLAGDQLEVDRWASAQTLYPRLKELAVLDEAFSEVADKDREKIRKSMLSKDQLDVAGSPRISARITEVREDAVSHGGVAFPYAAKLEMEIRGQRVEKRVAARYELAEGVVTIEAVGTFLFTDFAIKPYSAFFGAVKNEDEFHVYVNLKGSLPGPDLSHPAAR